MLIVQVIDGYAHCEVAQPDDVQWGYYDAQRGWSDSCERPSPYIEEALSAAIDESNGAISGEQAFLGVPGFEEILQSWRTLLDAGS